jgi:exodeoxyribonuclease V
LPKRGDKVICLHNNRELGVLNGQMFTVRKARKVNGGRQFMLRLTDEDGEKRVIMAWPDGFKGLQAQKDFEPLAHFHRECAFMTFGWAITCHKAQGSQWDNVLVVNESQVFRGDQSRWLYTAITRAASRVAVVLAGRRRAA